MRRVNFGAIVKRHIAPGIDRQIIPPIGAPFAVTVTTISRSVDTSASALVNGATAWTPIALKGN